MEQGEARVVDRAGLDRLFRALQERGYALLGPVVRAGAIVQGPLESTADMPLGVHDRQEPGRYELESTQDPTLFGWAVGPSSPKAAFFPPSELIWQAPSGVARGEAHLEPNPVEPSPPLALVGARPCELAALAVLDRVLAPPPGAGPGDPRYAARRAGTFVVVAECGAPAATCFCPSFQSGPGATTGFDLALTELLDPPGPRYLLRPASPAGTALLEQIGAASAQAADHESRRAVLASAEAAITRTMDPGIRQVLAQEPEHPRWEAIAERCLSCGNCTMVCPTCFCSDVSDTTDLQGTASRRRTWTSCFDLSHSFLHSGPVRSSVRSRYRQWMTHKLSTWWDQFGTSGCVGCGRCITWCPVGIDISQEAALLAAPAPVATP